MDIVRMKNAALEVLKPPHSKALYVMLGMAVTLFGIDIVEVLETTADIFDE